VQAFYLAIALAFPTPSVTAQQSSVEISVTIDGHETPEAVKLENAFLATPVEFAPQRNERLFVAHLSLQDVSDGQAVSLTNPVQLVVEWPLRNESESVFMMVGVGSPRVISVTIDGPTETAKFDLAALDEIDSRGSDLSSTVVRYLHARRFYRHWRFQKRQPMHQVALRSARIWFDASTALVTARPTIFRPDPDIEGFVREYLTDKRLTDMQRNRVAKYFPERILAAADAQKRSAPYSVVGDIPNLIKTRQVSEAARVNSAAHTALLAADPQTRTAVARNQGVTLDLLNANAQYIDTLQSQRSQRDILN
jgi:hypothetical protein